MGSRMSPVIIIILIAVVLAVGLFIVSMIVSGGKILPGSENQDETEIMPELELSIDTSEENQEKVIITAIAKTESKQGIRYIVLPDGQEVPADTATFEVFENGSYTFKVIGENDQEGSLSISVTNIKEASSDSPYVPSGFSVLADDIETGFVIEDENGNQYVWVPVPTGKLTRFTVMHSDYEESNNVARALVNSVAQNYGFYIARFESCETQINGKKAAGTIPGKVPWTNISYTDAFEYAQNSAVDFGYEGYYTGLACSYAWDTTLEWLDKAVENYYSNTGYGNYSGTIYPTGATQTDIVNNICDIAGNVREWTTEIYKGAIVDEEENTEDDTIEKIIYRVIRGGSASVSRTANSHTGHPENTSDSYWGFRMVLYK